MTTRHDGIQLAEGFHFTDHLTSSYRIAYTHTHSSYQAVYISNIDGSKRQKLFVSRKNYLLPPLCFSSDGTTLYGSEDRVWAKDIATGTVHLLPEMPIEPPYGRTILLDCSPDNYTLLLLQQGERQQSPDGTFYTAYRLCRASIYSTNFRVLVRDSYDVNLRYVACYWKYGFALVYLYRPARSHDKWELCKVNLETGELTPLCPPSTWERQSALRFNGTDLLWETFDNLLYTCSLADCVTRKLPTMGMFPEWAPEDKNIVFMRGQCNLCLWDEEQKRVQRLAGFDTPDLSIAEREGDGIAAPAWSPDGRLLWFALSQTRKLPSWRDPLTLLREVRPHLHPILRTLNLLYHTYSTAARYQYRVQKMGVIDFATRQVLLIDGFAYGVTWLPRPENATKT